MLRDFEFCLNNDQNRLGFDLKSDSTDPRYLSRLSRRIHFTLARRWLYLSLKYLEEDFFSFCRTDSFFFITLRIGPLIHGKGFLPLICLVGIQFVTAARNVSFQFCQSVLMSSDPSVKDRFIASRATRKPSKSPFS